MHMYVIFGLMFGYSKKFVVVVLMFLLGDVNAQDVQKPKLVVGIVLENFNPDYFYRYSSMFGEGGFSMLIENGVCFNNAAYPYLYSQTGVDQASIFSATSPSTHGIISHAWCDRFSKDVVSNVADKKAKELDVRKYSPKKLLVNTVGDELKKVNPFSRVFSVAMNAESSILSAGHSADAAYWFDEVKGEWTSAEYYMDSLTNWTKEFNKHLNLSYILKRGWNPYNMEFPKENSGFRLSSNFFYNLNKEFNTNGDYRIIKASPYANSLITEFAKNLIINENLGYDNDSDILSISYSFLDYKNDSFSMYSDEKLDVLNRLDKDVASLFKFLDEQIGLDNVLVFVTVSQAMTPSPEELAKSNLPGRYFDSYRAIALLKSYLNIELGAGDWILSYDSQQIFLNRELIKQSNLKLRDVQDIVTDFVIQFTGVSNVVSAHSMNLGNCNGGIVELMRESYNAKRSGDVLISLSPAWVNKLSEKEDYYARYSYRNNVPLFWYRRGMSPAKSNRSVSLLDVVPSVMEILGLPKSQFMNGKALEF